MEIPAADHRTHTVTLRLTKIENELLAQRAERLGKSKSALIRGLVFFALRRLEEGRNGK